MKRWSNHHPEGNTDILRDAPLSERADTRGAPEGSGAGVPALLGRLRGVDVPDRGAHCEPAAQHLLTLPTPDCVHQALQGLLGG